MIREVSRKMTSFSASGSQLPEDDQDIIQKTTRLTNNVRVGEVG